MNTPHFRCAMIALVRAVLLVLVSFLTAPALAVPDDDGLLFPDLTDLNGDAALDSIVLLPLGDEQEGGIAGDCVIGEVRVYSGATGQIITRFVATECDDEFGASVAVIRDLNDDGNDDLIIGAPMHLEGRVYLFLGPFGTGSGTEVIYADDAAIEFFPPAGYTRFGERVGSVSDLTGDGVADIRIRAQATSGPAPLMRTFIVSGVDGFPLFVVEGTYPFSPWTRPASDVDDDGDVDSDDLEVVDSNIGMSGSSVTIFDGDVTGDDQVNGSDHAQVQGDLGVNVFTPIIIGIDPPGGGHWGIWLCPDVPAPSHWCVPNCWDEEYYLPINVKPFCDVVVCQAWCEFTVEDLGAPLMPFDTYNNPYVLRATDGLQLTEVTWDVLEGADRIEVLSEYTGQEFIFVPRKNGPVHVRATSDVCTYICQVEVQTHLLLTDTDGDGMPDAWESLWPGFLDPTNPLDANEDPDLDGVTNIYEFGYWTDPTSIDAPADSDGDGIPDLCEISVGSDPNDPEDPLEPELDTDSDGLFDYFEECVFQTDPTYADSDNDGIVDGWEVAHGLDPLFAQDAWFDYDGDGMANLFEYFTNTDPNDSQSFPSVELDGDQDGVIDWIEEVFGSDPTDSQSVPAPGSIVFNPGDMQYMVVNSTIVPIENTVIELCVDECFKLHGTQWAYSWQVFQGADKLVEVSPDTQNSCLSSKWCITDTGTIVIGAATVPGSPGFPPGEGDPVYFGTITIIAKPAGECESLCGVNVAVGGGGGGGGGQPGDPPSETVCVGDMVTLIASGGSGAGEFEWTVLEFAQIVGGATGPIINAVITDPGEVTIGAAKGDCLGGVTLMAIAPSVVPDPGTHGRDASALLVLPGDEEKLTSTWEPASLPLMFEIADPSIAKFRVNGQLVSSVEQKSSPSELIVVGLEPGETTIIGKNDREDVPCTETAVKVGGAITIKYDQAPTFTVYPDEPGGGVGGGEEPPSGEGSIIIGGSAYQSGFVDARQPVSEELITIVNGTAPLIKATVIVVVLDAEGNPKKGKRVVTSFGRPLGPGGYGEPRLLAVREGELVTDENGEVHFTVTALANESNTPDLSQELSVIKDNMAVLVGRTAEKFLEGELTQRELNAIRSENLILERKFTGHSIEHEQQFILPDGGTLVTAAAIEMPGINHVHDSILRRSLESPSLFENVEGLAQQEVSLYIDEAGNLHVTGIGQVTAPFAVPSVIELVVKPTLIADFGAEIGLPDEENAPPGWPTTAITYGAIAAEIAIGMVPGGDLLDIFKEFIYKPLVSDESPNTVVGVIATVGLLLDSGYLAGPLGAAGNFVCAVMKAVFKFLPESVVMACMKVSNTAVEAITVIGHYIEKIPTPPGMGAVEAAVTKVQLVLDQWQKVIFSPLDISAEFLAVSMRKMSERASRHVSDEAFEGVATYAQFGDEGIDAIDELLTKIDPGNAVSEISTESIESVGEAIRKTYREAAPATPGFGELVGRVNEASAAARRTFSSQLRSFVNPYIGAGNAFRSMEEFEALRYLRRSHLRPDQQVAMRAISSAATNVLEIASGTPMYKAIGQGEALYKIAQDKRDLSGYLTFTEDMSGATTSAQVVDRLRLDYSGSPFVAGEAYVVVETPMTDVLRANARIPRTADYQPLEADEVLDVYGFPFTGHGFTASRDGVLARELKALETPMPPDVSVMKFKNGDGTPKVITIGPLSGDTWVLRQTDPNDPRLGFFWEPLQ